MSRTKAIAVLSVLCVMPHLASASEPVPRGILILDESAGAAAGPFYAAIVSSLRSSINRNPSDQSSIYVEHLDLSRFRGPEYESGLKTYLSAKYKDRPVNVIVAIGAGALRYILRSRDELWPAVPVVFTFVDTLSRRALTLPSDVTGTTFTLRFSDMVTAARAVVPRLTGVAVVGDALETLVPYRNFKEEIPVEVATGLQVIDIMGMPLREVRTRVANLPPQTAIVYTVMYSDGEGTFLTPVEALRGFASVANRPIVVTVETQVGQGAVGGYITSPSVLGEAAATLVLRLFRGEKAAEIPVNEGNVVKPVFDWRQLQRWDVSEAQLPPGSEVRFRQPVAWDQYRWQIVAIAIAVLLQAGLVHWLLYERQRRRHSDVQLRNTLSELAHVNRLATGSELSASIAHEIMQPLTGIVSSANAALRRLSTATPDVDKARAILTQIVSAGHRTAEVVRAIRAVFKKEVTRTQPVGMNGLIVVALDLVSNNIENHAVTVEANLKENLPVITGDPIQMQQVLLNLIVNAIDAMEALPNERKILRVKSEVEDNHICVSVEDSGPGVAPDMLDQIFKPLFTTKTQGMGLGLSICRSIVEMHNGRIVATPNQPRGLIVRLYLPIDQPET